MTYFSTVVFLIVSIAALVLLFYTNKKYFKHQKISKTISKYENISELNPNDLVSAKAELSKIGIDGKANESIYLREERVYSFVAIGLIIITILLALNIMFSDDARSLGKVFIAIFLVLIAGKFYELYRISKINKFLSRKNIL